jgi:hypothetical protein
LPSLVSSETLSLLADRLGMFLQQESHQQQKSVVADALDNSLLLDRAKILRDLSRLEQRFCASVADAARRASMAVWREKEQLKLLALDAVGIAGFVKLAAAAPAVVESAKIRNPLAGRQEGNNDDGAFSPRAGAAEATVRRRVCFSLGFDGKLSKLKRQLAESSSFFASFGGSGSSKETLVFSANVLASRDAPKMAINSDDSIPTMDSVGIAESDVAIARLLHRFVRSERSLRGGSVSDMSLALVFGVIEDNSALGYDEEPWISRKNEMDAILDRGNELARSLGGEMRPLISFASC